jgi:hypothetical protein
MTSPNNLGSSANYFFSSPNSAGGCDRLTGVTVTIAITEDLIAAPPPPNPPPNHTQSGFAFQLNASSPVSQRYPAGWDGSVYECSVNEVGPAADGSETSAPVVYINLTDKAGSFKNTWFYAGQGVQDQVLDVGIAAISGNTLVYAGVVAPNPNNQPWTEVARIWLGGGGDPDWIVWQQYIIAVHETVVGTLNNWTAASLSTEQTISGPDPARVLLAPPSPNMIPAGTTLKITLQNDADGNVTGVTFDALGHPAQSIALSALTTTGGQPVGTTFVAPIVAFTLDLVGPGEGKYAAFTSGAGTITYSASTPLTPSLQLPSCVANGAITEETSNSTYGTVPMFPSSSVTQSLGPVVPPAGGVLYECSVNQVGPAADGSETSAPVVYINLTDKAGSFKNTWFNAGQGVQDQVLDVGIAAISGNTLVWVETQVPNPANAPSTEVARIVLGGGERF